MEIKEQSLLREESLEQVDRKLMVLMEPKPQLDRRDEQLAALYDQQSKTTAKTRAAAYEEREQDSQNS